LHEEIPYVNSSDITNYCEENLTETYQICLYLIKETLKPQLSDKEFRYYYKNSHPEEFKILETNKVHERIYVIFTMFNLKIAIPFIIRIADIQDELGRQKAPAVTLFFCIRWFSYEIGKDAKKKGALLMVHN
jgi:hypothetical protein